MLAPACTPTPSRDAAVADAGDVVDPIMDVGDATIDTRDVGPTTDAMSDAVATLDEETSVGRADVVSVGDASDVTRTDASDAAVEVVLPLPLSPWLPSLERTTNPCGTLLPDVALGESAVLNLGPQSVSAAFRASNRVLVTDATSMTAPRWSLWDSASQRELFRGVGSALGLSNAVFLVSTATGQAELRSTSDGTVRRMFAAASGLSDDGSYVWTELATTIELRSSIDGSLLTTLSGQPTAGSVVAEASEFVWVRNVPSAQIARYSLATRTTTTALIARTDGQWSQDRRHFTAGAATYDRAGRTVTTLSVPYATRGVRWRADFGFELYELSTDRLLSSIERHPECFRIGFRPIATFADEENVYALDARGYLAVAPLSGAPMQIRATPFSAHRATVKVFADPTGAVLAFGGMIVDWDRLRQVELGCGEFTGISARTDGVFAIGTSRGVALVDSAGTPSIRGFLRIGLANNRVPIPGETLHSPPPRRSAVQWTPDGRSLVVRAPTGIVTIDSATYRATYFDDAVPENETVAMTVANGPTIASSWTMVGMFGQQRLIHGPVGAPLRMLSADGAVWLSPDGSLYSLGSGAGGIAGVPVYSAPNLVIAFLDNNDVLTTELDAFGRYVASRVYTLATATIRLTPSLRTPRSTGPLQVLSPTVVYAPWLKTRYDLTTGERRASTVPTEGALVESSALSGSRLFSLSGRQIIAETL